MDLIKDIYQRLELKNRVIVAIDGPCASGKTTYADKLAKEFNGIVFHMDDYFLPKELKTKERFSEIGGNVHHERLEEEILKHIEEDTVTYQKYNCRIESFEETLTVLLPKVIIVEGSYSLRSNLRPYYDIKILLEIDSQEQLLRLEKRNKQLLERFVKEWIPLENKYFEEERLFEVSDYIFTTKNTK